MGAKRIEIDVEVIAIFLNKKSLGYDEDSDGEILVPQTKVVLGCLKKSYNPALIYCMQFELTHIIRNTWTTKSLHWNGARDNISE